MRLDDLIRRNKKGICIMTIPAALIAAGMLYWAKSASPPPGGPTARAERGDIQSIVSATGSISAVVSVDVSSKVTGLIKEVKVNENDLVRAGQVLLILDDISIRSQVAKVRARYDNAAANLERAVRLAASGAISSQQRDAARLEYDVARAAYEDVVSQLADMVIKAPIDGQVIGKPIPAGQTIAPGIASPMVLMTIADLSKMQILAQVDETDIGKVAPGQKVAFTVDAYPGKTFVGSVSSISRKANIQQNVVYYPVMVDIDSPVDLKPTMTARLSIFIAESKGAVTIPLTAIKEHKGRHYVQALADGSPKYVTVKLGLSNDTTVEILSGLNEGDQVMLPTPRPATTGGMGMQQPNPLRGITGRGH